MREQHMILPAGTLYEPNLALDCWGTGATRRVPGSARIQSLLGGCCCPPGAPRSALAAPPSPAGRSKLLFRGFPLPPHISCLLRFDVAPPRGGVMQIRRRALLWVAVAVAWGGCAVLGVGAGANTDVGGSYPMTVASWGSASIDMRRYFHSDLHSDTGKQLEGAEGWGHQWPRVSMAPLPRRNTSLLTEVDAWACTARLNRFSRQVLLARRRGRRLQAGDEEGELDLDEGEEIAGDEAARLDGEADMELVVAVDQGAKGSLAGLGSGGAQMLRGRESGAQRIDMLFGSLDAAGLRRELYMSMGWRRVKTVAPDGTEESSWEFDGTKPRSVESFLQLIQRRLQLEVEKVDSLTACCPKTASEDIICVCNSVYGAAGDSGGALNTQDPEAQKRPKGAANKGGKGVADGITLSVNNKYVEVLGAGAVGKGKKMSPQREDCLVRLMNNRIEERFAAVQASLKEAGASGEVPRPAAASGPMKWTPKDERWVQECIVHETNTKKKETREQKQMQEMAMQLAKSMSGYERKHATITFKHSGLVKMVPLSELLDKTPEGKTLLDGGKT